MTASTLTLTDFLLARIAEDEERAEFVRQQIESSPYSSPEPWLLSWHDEYDLLCVEPSRALAECEAKRRIVNVARYAPEGSGGWGFQRILRDLALPYADHPDFDPSWRP